MGAARGYILGSIAIIVLCCVEITRSTKVCGGLFVCVFFRLIVCVFCVCLVGVGVFSCFVLFCVVFVFVLGGGGVGVCVRAYVRACVCMCVCVCGFVLFCFV